MEMEREISSGEMPMSFTCAFCDQDYSDRYNKIDVRILNPTTDEECLSKMKQAFILRVEAFKPEYIFWEYGYDATKAEYGDRGVSRDLHIKLAELIKDCCR